MAGYIFNSNQTPTLHIPKIITDKFLKDATGAQIKVILCLIAFESMPMTVENIASCCNLAKDDVSDAISFWIKNEILIRRGASLILASNTSVQAQNLPRYNAESLLEKKTEDKSFSFLVDEVQRIIGKTLNHTDISVVLAMYDHLNFSTELILMIINYCISNQKTSFRYIEKIALDWFDRGIDTFEKAELLIKNLEKKARIETSVAAYFGIDNRALSKKEQEYIETWYGTFKMSVDMIRHAYEICIDKKAKLSFSYINAILADWFKKGYKTVADIEDNDSSAPKNIKSFDTDEVEKELLKRLVGE